MRIYIALTVSVVIGTLLSILVRNITRRINRKIWRFSKIDTLVSYLPYTAIFCAIILGIGAATSLSVLMSAGAVGLISVILFNVVILLTLPFSWMIDFINLSIQAIK